MNHAGTEDVPWRTVKEPPVPRAAELPPDRDNCPAGGETSAGGEEPAPEAGTGGPTGPSLADRRAQASALLAGKCGAKPTRPASQAYENVSLRAELRRARELADECVGAECKAEVDRWRGEVVRLRAVEELRQQTARACEEEQVLQTELCAEARRHEELADEVDRRNAMLRRSLEQQAVLGPAGGGTAHLFVSALPALDLESVKDAWAAVDLQLRQLQARG